MNDEQLGALTFVMVVGCQRSGTTLLGQVIGAHRNAVLVDEPECYRLVDAICDGSLDASLLNATLLQSRTIYADRDGFDASRTPGLTHVVLKAPNATYRHAELACVTRWMLRFVFCIRDVRDVVASMGRLVANNMVARQIDWLQRAPNALQSGFDSDARHLRDESLDQPLRRAYVWKIKSAQYREFLRAPLSGLLMRYELFVSRPEAEKRRLCEHLGLPIEGLEPHQTVMRGTGPGMTVRRRSVDAESVSRWEDSISPETEERIWQIAGTLMRELDYDRSTAAPTRQEVSAQMLDQPVVLVGRGGSGTRLLSLLVQEHGVFIGNEINASGDSVEWVDVIYELVLRRFSDAGLDPDYAVARLRKRASTILTKGLARNEASWGWKLPETTLLLPLVLSAFPRARVIHLVRNPVDTCLRRTHMTSRWDNPVGTAVMRAAQTHCGITLDPSTCPEHLSNAVSWEFQMAELIPLLSALPPERHLQLAYEDVCDDVQRESDRIASFLSLPTRTTDAGSAIDTARRRKWADGDERAHEVGRVCRSAAGLGY